MRPPLPPSQDVCKLLASTPSLLTYDVRTSLPHKLEALQSVLPGCASAAGARSRASVYGGNACAAPPPLLPPAHPYLVKHATCALRSADVPRLVRLVPQLLEYDVDGTLAPKARH